MDYLYLLKTILNAGSRLQKTAQKLRVIDRRHLETAGVSLGKHFLTNSKCQILLKFRSSNIYATMKIQKSGEISSEGVDGGARETPEAHVTIG